MPRLTQFFVYMMTNRSRTFYTGITRDLVVRVDQHRTKALGGFTARYNIDQLVYYEVGLNVRAAIEREKQIKGWTRRKKIVLIDSLNPTWRDLSAEWRADGRDPSHSLRMTNRTPVEPNETLDGG
jgi:putative endonuclease